MNLCSCWKEYTKYVIKENESYSTLVQICNGTKEREECSCNGDKSKCNFYLKNRKENKSMNSAEMWIKAQEDGMCYETTEGPYTLYYQKDKGLFDSDECRCGPETWNYFDDLMNEQWQLRIMTKSEAEAKFNIKIID